ncbi:uncharacterized protein METZ01_LOCUS376949 [marine metagenome]|uniref:Uncharacterized protein n=1 Tax=marine metagenome TaxID=408172 RepID=A0A382TQR9_9ZZZZ
MTVREILKTKEAENVCRALSEYNGENEQEPFDHIDFCNIIDKILTISTAKDCPPVFIDSVPDSFGNPILDVRFRKELSPSDDMASPSGPQEYELAPEQDFYLRYSLWGRYVDSEIIGDLESLSIENVVSSILYEATYLGSSEAEIKVSLSKLEESKKKALMGMLEIQ